MPQSFFSFSIHLSKVIILLLTLCSFEGETAASFPTLTGRIVDNANILSTSIKSIMDSKLKSFEGDAKGPQLVLVTVKSLEGRSIEEYTLDLGRYWKIGHKEKNNGIILLIAPNERKVRIEVGYGLEHILTDASADQIIKNILIPELKKNNWDAAAQAGIEAIIKKIDSLSHKSESAIQKTKFSEIYESFIILLIIVFIMVIIIKVISYFLFLILLVFRCIVQGVNFILKLFINVLNAILGFYGLNSITFKGIPLPSRNKLWIMSGCALIEGSSFFSFFSLGGGGFSGGGGGFGGGGSSGRF
jgi:uncharacterized protein